MNHLGDVTKINGAEITPVDVIIGGSPCQDLSVAGKRAGLAGARSGLFMEQIRIVKEMRNATNGNRPRFMVWENVPGAFSSNKGYDFAAVLEETIRIVEPEAPCVDVPEHGWPTWGQYRDVGGRWSVAWRVLDAQYWGVPQRRRRIALVADFGGSAAGEILFNRKGVSRDSEPCGETREDAAAGTESGAGDSVWCLQGNGIDRADNAGCNRRGWRENQSYTLNTVDSPAVACLTPWDPQNERIYDEDGVFHTLNAGEKAGQARDGVFCAAFKPNNSSAARSIGYSVECAPTLDSGAGGNKPTIFDMSHANHVISECGEIAPALVARMGTGGNQVPITMRYRSFGDYEPSEHASTLKTRNTPDNSDVVCVFGLDCRNGRETEELCGTLQSKPNGGYSYNCTHPIRIARTYANGDFGKYYESNVSSTCLQRDYKGTTNLALKKFVRRLTPLECERLQGFPDGWTDIGDWTDSKGKKRKTSDAARYKALGNSIALPPWKWVLKRLCAEYERDATMGSLFDGIGGFPLIWEQLNGRGSCLWASEIEEFCIAVTKRRFGG